MALDRLPAYVRKVERDGKRSYYWELPPWARPTRNPETGKLEPRMRHGRPMLLTSEALGTDQAAAVAKADNLNAALREWRTGEGEGSLKIMEGTVEWLFAWYRQQDRFLKNVHKTRTDYTKLMNMLAALPTKRGGTLGQQQAKKVDATVADALYKRLRTETGERQATYAMQVCRLVWTWAVRHRRTTGVSENPFMGMGLKSTAAKGNRPTSRAEYDAYRAAAHKLGLQSMATAAALAFEGCQRTWDVFGFTDPDGVKRRGIPLSGYEPGVRLAFSQSKTGNLVSLPLHVDVPGEAAAERVYLYPELEDELALAVIGAREGQDTFVVDERTGQRYSERYMSSVHRRICDAAGLPKEMTFTGFRHGGLTEIGDSGEADPRAVSGHKTLAVTAIYNKASEEKARRIATARREHIAALIAADEGKGAGR